MLKPLRKAYKGGWRAGAATPLKVVINGLTYIQRPENPYTRWHQLALNFLWQEGVYRGTVQRLTTRRN